VRSGELFWRNDELPGGNRTALKGRRKCFTRRMVLLHSKVGCSRESREILLRKDETALKGGRNRSRVECAVFASKIYLLRSTMKRIWILLA
jgi:hypothetical protein